MKTGSEWNGWTAEEYLGQGSFGKVYKITREEFGHRYESALKVIRIPRDPFEVTSLRNEGMSDEEITSYFYGMVQDITSEFALMSQLRGNSNIASYEDHEVEKLPDEFGWEVYLRMELLTPLYGYLGEHALTAKDVVRLGIDISQALETCEKNNIIHRDIKPDNIFWSRQGTFKLGDFGIARKLEKADAGLSKKGTFTYMAPEVYRGESYDHRADIYSLGIVLYRFLNNNRGPFQNHAQGQFIYSETEEATIRRMKGEKLTAPSNADETLSSIILKTCSFRPEDRYQSASELRRDLESVLDAQDDQKPVIPMLSSDDETVTMFSDEGFDDGSNMDDREIGGSEPAADVKALRVKDTAKDPGKVRKKRLITVISAICVLGILLFSYMFTAVPDITGSAQEAAEEKISKAGFGFEIKDRTFSYDIGRGKVISQDPEGSRAWRGSTVRVVISRGKAVEAPDLAGMTVKSARKDAEKKKLDIKVGGSEYSDSVRKGCVIRQDPASGAECEEGQKIIVIKSKGPEQVNVPDVSGKAYDEARKILEKAGFKASEAYGYSASVAAGYVMGQDPAAGSTADKGSTVTITVSSGPAPSYTSNGSSRSSKGSSGKKNSKKSSNKSSNKSSSGSSSSDKHGKGVKL